MSHENPTSIGRCYLEDVRSWMERNKRLAERAMAQLSDAQLHWTSDPQSNSVAILVRHIAGNQRSRWTRFLYTDGEKADRDRDGEFVDDLESRAGLMARWEQGWRTCFEALDALDESDLLRDVTIRGRACTVLDALNRQLGHYAYHVGQIVHLARQQVGPEDWVSLSIPRAPRP